MLVHCHARQGSMGGEMQTMRVERDAEESVAVGKGSLDVVVAGQLNLKRMHMGDDDTNGADHGG